MFRHSCCTTVMFLMVLFGLGSSPTNDPRRTPALDEFISFQTLSIEDGLSQSAVTCLLQDRTGFLWIGTQNGLNRYDGYSFKVYQYVPEQTGSISDSGILAIFQDHRGILWVGTEGGGLNRYNPQTDTFITYRHDGRSAGNLSNDFITALAEDRQGNLWVGTNGGGIDRLGPDGHHLNALQHDPANPRSLGSDSITALSLGPDGHMWIGTSDAGLYRYDPLTGDFTRFQHRENQSRSISSDKIRVIFPDSAGHLWIGTSDAGLNLYDPVTSAFRHFRHDPTNAHSIADNQISAITEVNYREIPTLWIGTNNGVSRFNPDNGQFTTYRHDLGNPDSVSDNKIWSLAADNTGLLWIGTAGGGVTKVLLNNKRFHHLYRSPSSPDQLADDVVWSFTEDSAGFLWVGTANGLNRIHLQTLTSDVFQHDPGDASSLSENTVRALLNDHRGRLWIGTEGGGLDQLVREDGQIRFHHLVNHPDNPNSLSDNNVTRLFEDRSGLIWIGTNGGGLNRFDPSTGQFTRYLHSGTDSHSLINNRVYAIAQDKHGQLWIGTLGGLSRLDPKTGQWKHYRYRPDDPYCLSNNGVGVVYVDSQSTVWIGTDRGLNRYDPVRDRFARYTVKQGMADDFIYGILEDDSEQLWLSTNRGLSQFNPTTGQVRNFDVTDGLQSNEFDSGAFYQDRRGRLFFGGINGVTYFIPAQIQLNRHVPPVVITSFKIFDQTIAIPTTAGETIRLGYRDNFFSFEFAALDFTAPEKNLYAYKLEGFDDRWIESGTRRFASYTNLDGGEYVFRVRGSNDDGIWNRSGTSLRIVISPAPWRTWWAYTIYAIVLFAAIFGIVQIKLQSEARKVATRLSDLTSSLSSTLDLEDVLERLLAFLFTIVNFSHSSVLMKGDPEYSSAMSFSPGQTTDYECLPLELAAAHLFPEIEKTRRPLLINDLHRDRRLAGMEFPAATRAWLGIPLVARNELIGLVVLESQQPGKFHSQTVELLHALVGQAGFAIENARLFGEVERLATTDSLTGVHTRRHFFTLAEQEFQRARRYGRELAVIMLDLDHFKNVNDTFGHSAGDQALRVVTDRCRELLRTTDFIGRYGGEEFVIVLPETNIWAARHVAQRVRKVVGQQTIDLGNGQEQTVTISLGVAGLTPRPPLGSTIC